MKLLLFYWSMILTGIILGTLSRKHGNKFGFLGVLLTAIVFLIVFVMGVKMGINREVVTQLHTIGLEATILSFFIMGGSVLAVFLVKKFIGMEMKATVHEGKVKSGNGNKFSLAILVTIALGLLVGYALVPILFDLKAFDIFSSKFIVVSLSAMLFLIGTEIGLAGTIASNIKSAGFRIMIFPFVVVLGSFAGAILGSVFLPLSMKEALAVSSGFGWFTLAPIIITDHGYPIAGAIAFIHNVIREYGGLVLIPIVSKYFGCIEAAALPGVAAMDVAIPVLERMCGERIIIYSFLIGLVQSAMVPVLVPLFISL